MLRRRVSVVDELSPHSDLKHRNFWLKARRDTTLLQREEKSTKR
jgi:hypothetical protein